MAKTEDIIFIDKPAGITSFDVVSALRRKLGVKRIGHAGTLDPFATGLLILGVGAGTKKLKEFEALPKTYVMGVLVGRSTDTGDPEGKIIEEKEAREVKSTDIEKILSGMEGKLELPIPKYSAVKHKGKPLYKYARKGIEVEEKLRTTEIFYLKLMGERATDGSTRLTACGKTIFEIEMKCEKGTYARAVGEEIGRRLGFPAMLVELRRTKIGDIDVNKARKLEEIQNV